MKRAIRLGITVVPGLPRWCSTISRTAVNVEAFTLNDDIVAEDMKWQSSWKEFQDALNSFRVSRNFKAMVKHLEAGKELYMRAGPDNSPVNCNAALSMEKAQAHYNLGETDLALIEARDARRAYENVKDVVGSTEGAEFEGFVLLKGGDAGKAHAVFTELVRWMDNEARREMPMVQLHAKNLRRTTTMGLGMALAAKGNHSEALDKLIDALQAHVEEGDVSSGKMTLSCAVECYVALRDYGQAAETCEKLKKWCSRNGDEEGAAAADRRLAELLKSQAGK